MANTNINLVGLDFNDLKSNFKEYLKRSDSPFKDVDFEGSNISQLLDIFSYNTHLNAFYLNMIASEMFLDSATLKDSVVSHAKELNYVPRSFRSAQANISFYVTPSTSLDTLLLPKGTSFTTKVGSNNYTFVTDSAVVLVANSSGSFNANNLMVYEGNYISDTFVYSNANTTQRFVLSNPTIDTNSITVMVLENSGANSYTYTRASSFLDQQANSKIFFLQAAENSQYELVFGDDVIGRKPQNGSTIVVEYRVCNGELPNGVSTFTIDGPIQGQSNISSITTNTIATGGAVSESLDSIKYNAPRYYQNQDRAVTATDYENLLLANFSEITAVSAYGGEDANPPQYGRVIISADVASGYGFSETEKNRFINFLKTRGSVGIEPVFEDPEYLYVEVDATARYNTNVTTMTGDAIESLIRGVVSSFNTDNLNGFKKTLRYSKLLESIDNVSTSIVGAELSLHPFRKLDILVNVPTDYTINLGFELSKYYNISTGTEDYVRSAVRAVYSSRFTYNGQSCTLQDDSNGNLNIYNLDSDGNSLFVKTVGSVDYTGGVVEINGLTVEDYVGSAIHLHVNPASKDISTNKNTILKIRDQDVEVITIPVVE